MDRGRAARDGELAVAYVITHDPRIVTLRRDAPRVAPPLEAVLRRLERGDLLRPNHRMYDADFLYRTQGVVRDFFARDLRPTPIPDPAFTRILVALARAHDPEFQFTSIQINLNFSRHLHVDGSNRGPTLMFTFGDAVEGGDLWVYPGDRLATLGRWVRFDGRTPHCTYPYTGTRVSVVFYTHCMWQHWHAALSEFALLRELGFPLPETRVPLRRPSGRANRAKVDAAVAVLPAELEACKQVYHMAETSKTRRRDYTHLEFLQRESALLRAWFVKTGKVRRGRAPQRHHFASASHFRLAALDPVTLCAHPHHLGDRVVARSSMHSNSVCIECHAFSRCRRDAPCPSSLPLPTFACPPPQLSALRARTHAAPATKPKRVWLERLGSMPCAAPCDEAAPVAPECVPCTPSPSPGAAPRRTPPRFTAETWADHCRSELDAQIASGARPRVMHPPRSAFPDAAEFERATPFRVCLDPLHDGARALPLTATFFSSSGGRLTHCRPCKRRYIAQRRAHQRAASADPPSAP